MEDTSKNRDLDIVCAGHGAVDVIPRFPSGKGTTPEEMFKPGRLINVEEAEICNGGSAPNTGIALKKLGMSVALLIRVGDDHFGKIMMDIIDGHGIKEAIHMVPGEHTSYTLVISPPGFDRMFLHCPGSNDNFSREDLDRSILERAKLLHLGYPPLMRRMYTDGGRELAGVLEISKECGNITSLDLALPDPNSESGQVDWTEILERSLPFVDIFIPSIEEALYVTLNERYHEYRTKACDRDIVDVLDGDVYTELSDRLLECGAKIVVLKAGHRGYYIRTAHACVLSKMQPELPGKLADWAGREIWVPAYFIKDIASATGSGDTSIAGFLTAYLKGENPVRAASLANAVGCQNLSALSAVGGIKGWQDTLDIVNDTTRERLLFELRAPGWRFDEEGKMWIGPKDTI